MLPQSYIEVASANRQDLESAAQRQRLVNQAQARRENPGVQYSHLLVRFGGWLVTQGERIEARYRLDSAHVLPVETAADAG